MNRTKPLDVYRMILLLQQRWKLWWLRMPLMLSKYANTIVQSAYLFFLHARMYKSDRPVTRQHIAYCEWSMPVWEMLMRNSLWLTGRTEQNVKPKDMPCVSSVGRKGNLSHKTFVSCSLACCSIRSWEQQRVANSVWKTNLTSKMHTWHLFYIKLIGCEWYCQERNKQWSKTHHVRLTDHWSNTKQKPKTRSVRSAWH